MWVEVSEKIYERERERDKHFSHPSVYKGKLWSVLKDN